MKTIFTTYHLILVALAYSLLSSSAHAQVHYLDLSQQMITLPTRTFYVEQVVDGRPGQPGIGFVYRGLGNRPAAVLFRRGIEPELTDFLQTRLPSRPTDQPIVVCLRQLRVSEVLNGLTEDAYADLAADIYVHRPAGYHFVRSVAGRKSGRGLEMTARHITHLAGLLQECLGQLEGMQWEPPAGSPARTLAQLPTDVPPALTATATPAILHAAPRRGLYYDFAQFLTNLPDTTQFISADTVPARSYANLNPALWQGIPRVFPVAIVRQGKQRVSSKIWGFSDGRQLYIQHRGSYFPLMRQSTFFTFVGEAPFDTEYTHARTRAQLRTGLLGVATQNVPNRAHEPTPYAVDMRTGQATPFPGAGTPIANTPAYVYLYRRADASPQPVVLFADGQEIGRLGPDEYLELEWPHPARMLRLCLGSPDQNACRLFMPDASQASYLRIFHPAALVAPTWQPVSVEQGETDLAAIDEAPNR